MIAVDESPPSTANNRALERLDDLKYQFEQFDRRKEFFLAQHCDSAWTNQNTGIGWQLNEVVLVQVIELYFAHLSGYKEVNAYEHRRINHQKIGALSAFWINACCPLYDTRSEPFSAILNTEFALFAGMSIAQIDLVKARSLRDGYPFKALQQSLLTRHATAESLIAVFELLHSQAPIPNQI